MGLFRYSRDRLGDHRIEHLGRFADILQVGAKLRYNRLNAPGNFPEPITEALDCSHSRRTFYDLAHIAPPISPLAMEAAKRFDALFGILPAINRQFAERPLATRRDQSAVSPVASYPRSGLARHKTRLVGLVALNHAVWRLEDSYIKLS